MIKNDVYIHGDIYVYIYITNQYIYTHVLQISKEYIYNNNNNRFYSCRHSINLVTVVAHVEGSTSYVADPAETKVKAVPDGSMDRPL